MRIVNVAGTQIKHIQDIPGLDAFGGQIDLVFKGNKKQFRRILEDESTLLNFIRIILSGNGNNWLTIPNEREFCFLGVEYVATQCNMPFIDDWPHYHIERAD